MSVHQNFSATAGPSNYSQPSQTVTGITPQGEVVSYRQVQPCSRRNSFDFVIDTTNAEVDVTNDLTAVKPLAPSTPAHQPADSRKSPKTETWEDIELQEWPTASRLAALSANTPSTLPHHNRRMPVSMAAAPQTSGNLQSGSFLTRIWGQAKNLVSGNS